MKIQKISTNNYKQNFTASDRWKDYHYDYDYGTYYNQISLKDSIISAGILSGIFYFACLILGNADTIKSKVKSTLNKVV